jgi:hypothetical protein
MTNAEMFAYNYGLTIVHNDRDHGAALWLVGAVPINQDDSDMLAAVNRLGLRNFHYWACRGIFSVLQPAD